MRWSQLPSQAFTKLGRMFERKAYSPPLLLWKWVCKPYTSYNFWTTTLLYIKIRLDSLNPKSLPPILASPFQWYQVLPRHLFCYHPQHHHMASLSVGRKAQTAPASPLSPTAGLLPLPSIPAFLLLKLMAARCPCPIVFSISGVSRHLLSTSFGLLPVTTLVHRPSVTPTALAPHHPAMSTVHCRAVVSHGLPSKSGVLPTMSYPHPNPEH